MILVLGVFSLFVWYTLRGAPTTSASEATSRPNAEATALASSASTANATMQECGTWSLQTDVQLLSEPRADAPMIRRLQRGWDVIRACDEPIRADSITWAKVKRGDDIGWVMVEAVNTPTPEPTTTATAEPTTQATPTSTPTKGGTGCLVYKLASTLDGKPLNSLAIHADAGLSSRTIGYLKTGQQARVMSTEIKNADGREWIKVQSPDADGWASLRALECVQ